MVFFANDTYVDRESEVGFLFRWFEGLLCIVGAE